MIRISITFAAFEAIAATMPLGTVAAAEPARDEQGERMIWLDPGVVNRLRALREPGESFSDVILRLAEGAPT
jgi:long-subunit fatty acid transport protein